jgi:hypothetical protein
MIYKYNVPFWFIPEGGTVSDETLITHVLLYGQPKDIINLIDDYGLEKCYEIFKVNVYPQRNIKGRTVKLLEVIFNALFNYKRKHVECC